MPLVNTERPATAAAVRGPGKGRLSARRQSHNMPGAGQQPSPMAVIAVYDGRTLVGEVVESSSGRWEAHDAAGRLIGAHRAARTAPDALRAARREGQP